MRSILFYPPFADPTQPYLSLPTLKGYLKREGFDARVIDLNIEATCHILNRNFVEGLRSRVKARFLELDKKKCLSFHEQVEYSRLYDAIQKVDRFLGSGIDPLRVFREEALFYNKKTYNLATEITDSLFHVLNAAHFPYQFGFNRAVHSVVPWSFAILDTYYEKRHSPLDLFYRSYIEKEVEPASLDFVGISLTFPAQIPETFYLCRLIKELAPGCFILLGGTLAHQIMCGLKDNDKARLLRYVDAVCLFEGEVPLLKLFSIMPELKIKESNEDRIELLRQIPNLVVYNEKTKEIHTGPPYVLDLNDSALPDYSDLDLDRYLAPSRTLLYAPTRGCYWRKCSFCYYGFSQSSPYKYREIPAEKAVHDIDILSKLYNVSNFYISCDVLAPHYTADFAKAIVEKNLQIHWSSDLRIEKHYTPEICSLLYKSGLRAVAFGVESGSERMLKLMQKGINIDTIRAVNRNFHNAGIATAWMMFNYHPNEKLEDAIKTVEFTRQELDRLALFIIGEFELTPGSRIARCPADFGITNIYFTKGDSLKIYPLFLTKEPSILPEMREMLDIEIEKLAQSYIFRWYPWAGAISTHHSLLYFVKFGQRVFAHKRENPDERFPPAKVLIPSFSISKINRNEDRFMSDYMDKALSLNANSQEASLSLEDFLKQARRVKPLARIRKKRDF